MLSARDWGRRLIRKKDEFTLSFCWAIKVNVAYVLMGRTSNSFFSDERPKHKEFSDLEKETKGCV